MFRRSICKIAYQSKSRIRKFTTDTSSHESIVNRLSDLEKSVMDRINVVNRNKFRSVGLSLLSVSTTAFIFRDNIKSLFVDTTSDTVKDVVSQTVNDQEIIDNGAKYVTEVSNQLLQSKKFEDEINNLLYTLIQREDVQQNLANLIYDVLRKEETLDVITQALYTLITRDDVKQNLTDMVVDVLQRQEVIDVTEQSLGHAITELTKNEEIKKQLSEMLSEVIYTAIIPSFLRSSSNKKTDIESKIVSASSIEV